MIINFDHIYTMDHNHKFMKKLEMAGFTLAKHMVEHPGKHMCRFIMISEKPARQYMEFVHVGKGGVNYGNPGLSLGTETSLEKFNQVLKRKGLKTSFSHKNYDWKKDSESRLPGWNFITFPNHKTNVFTWLTEYEFSAKRKKNQKPVPKHKNMVKSFVGISAELIAADIKLFQKMFGSPKHNVFELKRGFEIQFAKAKKSKILDVIFEVPDLKKYITKFKWDELTISDGAPAVRIKNDTKNMWSVVIRQKV